VDNSFVFDNGSGTVDDVMLSFEDDESVDYELSSGGVFWHSGTDKTTDPTNQANQGDQAETNEVD